MITPIRSVSVLGCGWLGRPLAERLLAEGYVVRGSTTTADKLAALRTAGIDAVPLALNPQPEGDLTTLLQSDVLIVNVPPKAGQRGDAFHPEQVRYVVEAVRDSAVRWVIYVSSTSVYPELNRVVTETDVLTPEQSAAPALVQAEQLVQALAPSRLVTVLRCAGLMGYDRTPGKYVAGRPVDTGAVPVNYVHRDDVVNQMVAVLARRLSGVYNVVAPEHPTREQVYRASCARYGFALPHFVAPDTPPSFKIVSGNRMEGTTQLPFLHPDPLQFP